MKIEKLESLAKQAEQERWSRTLVTHSGDGSYRFGATIDHKNGTYTLSVFRINKNERNSLGGMGRIESHPINGKMWRLNRHKLGHHADSMVTRLVERIADKIGLSHNILKIYEKKI